MTYEPGYEPQSIDMDKLSPTAREFLARQVQSYCESCEADRLWEAEGIQPVWASPTHTCNGSSCEEHAHLGHSAEVPCYWCSAGVSQDHMIRTEEDR